MYLPPDPRAERLLKHLASRTANAGTAPTWRPVAEAAGLDEREAAAALTLLFFEGYVDSPGAPDPYTDEPLHLTAAGRRHLEQHITTG